MNQGRVPTLVLGASGLLIFLGAGGWLFVSMDKQQKQTKQTLARTEASLQEKAKDLTLAEEARQKLSSDYDALKSRWTKTDDELQQVKTTAERTQEQLASASSERSVLQQRLTDADQRLAALQSETEKVRHQVEQAAQERSAWEKQLATAANAGLTRAELEQLSDVTAKREAKSEDLENRMEALSHAFEQLAWKHIELQEATGKTAPSGPSPLAEEPAMAGKGTSAIGQEQTRQEKRQAQQLARRYRHLGEFCLAAYQYTRAADAFEKSLTYVEDPGVHASLAFIYGRLLMNPEEAAVHTALASESKINAEHTFEEINRSSGMPRRSRDVVWRWLANE